MMKPDDEEAPAIQAGPNPANKSPYRKLIEQEVDKYKVVKPIELKKNLCNGKVSLQVAELGDDKSIIKYRVVFMNKIGKILYNAYIEPKLAKIRHVTEKVHKNQLKIACYKPEDPKNKIQYCVINFGKLAELQAFQKEYSNIANGS